MFGCAVALGKFNEGVVTYDAEGEVELDLEKVDYTSLMEVRQGECVLGGAYAGMRQLAHAS